MNDINYAIAIPVIVAALAVLFFLIRRNQKDEKKFERDVSQSEIKPEKHTDDEVHT